MNKKNFSISILTVFVQYYDYHLFGFLAAKIAAHFFPDAETIVQLLNAYFIMAVGVIAKPLGAIIFGKIGDQKGRSDSFALSLIGTAIASFVLFLAPSYESVGLIAVFILLACRLTICAFASSGADGVRIYIYEHIDKKNQCLGVGITTLFTLGGSFAASMSALAFTLDILPDYSWKFAFLAGSLIGLSTLIIMKVVKFQDTVKLDQDASFEEFRSLSLNKIIRNNWKLFILCTLLAGGVGSANQFIIIFFGTYNFSILKIIDHSLMQKYTSIAIVIYMIFSVIGGYMADKIGRYKVTIVASIIVIISTLLLCASLSAGHMNPILYFIMTASLAFINIPAAAIFKQAIPMAIRYRIFSLSHAVGSILLSAPTAFISTFLYHKTAIAWAPLAYFISIILIISLVLYKLTVKNNIKSL